MHRIDVQLSETQVIDIHQIEHAIRLRFTPVVPGVIWKRASPVPMRERSSLTETFFQARALMARLTSTPVSVCPRRIFTRSSEHAAPFVHARIIGVEEESLERRARRTLEGLDQLLPRLDERRVISLAREQVDTSTSVRNVEAFGINTHKARKVPFIFEFLLHLIPRSVAHVLQNDNGGLTFTNPIHHATESLSRFTLSFKSLPFVVEIRVVNAGRTRDEHVHVVRHVNLGAVRRRRFIATQFTNITE